MNNNNNNDLKTIAMKKIILFSCILIASFSIVKADPYIAAFKASPSNGTKIGISGSSLSVNFRIEVTRSLAPGGSSYEQGTINLRLVYQTSTGQIEPITAYQTYYSVNYNGPFLTIIINNINIPSSSIGKFVTIQYSYWSEGAQQTVGPYLSGIRYAIVEGGNSGPGTGPDTTAITSWPMAMVSKLDNGINIFARGTDGYAIRKRLDPTTNNWLPWERFEGKRILFQPVGLTKDDQTMDIYIVGEDQHLYQQWWSSSTGWSGWRDFGGNFASVPAVLSKDDGRSIDIFILGTDQHLYHKWWKSADANNSSGGWSTWRDYGGNFISAPTAISKDGGNSVDLFAIAADNHLFHRWWKSADANNSSGGWSTWRDYGGNFTYSPAALSKDGGKSVDLFVTGTNQRLYHKWWKSADANNGSGGWSAWHDYGGSFSSSPAAISKDGGKSVELFVTGTDQHLYYKWWNSADWNSPTGGWSAWANMDGILTSPPAVVHTSGYSFDVFVRGATPSLFRREAVVGYGWRPWVLISGQ